MREASITDYKYIDWFHDHPVEDDPEDAGLVRHGAAGQGLHRLVPVRAPATGRCQEIGGCRTRSTPFAARPPHLLEEIARFPDWLLWNALTSPKLELVHAASKSSPMALTAWRWGTKYRTFAHLRLKRAANSQTRGLVSTLTLPRGASPRFRRSAHAGELEARLQAPGQLPDRYRPMGDRAKLSGWCAARQECRGRGGAPRRRVQCMPAWCWTEKARPNQRQVLFICASKCRFGG